MTRRITLRPWQQAALDARARSGAADFLAVATPGAGKTTFALVAVITDLQERPGRPVVVVAPTAHLKTQWAAAADELGLHLDPAWSPTEPFPRDMHGIVTTYQQAASAPDVLAARCRGGLVVLDEIHHAGDEQAWGAAIAHAFAGADRRLALSGTPFRSDSLAIPFVRYEDGVAAPDYEYGYAEALRDGVVRPVYFPRVDGEMEWVAPDGAHLTATFADRLDRVRASQRLRTALSVTGDWLPDVLTQAHATLRQMRRRDGGAAGLAIATDQEHARGIAALLAERCGTRPVVVTSDDPAASARIAAFASSREEWIVAVRMVSEGVDIPRLRVGVFATTTTTELFFRQAVGRLVRVTGGTQRAVMFIPDDVRLRAHAMQIAESRRHQLRPPADRDERDLAGEPRVGGSPADQLSLFQALGAVATATHAEPEWMRDDPLPSGMAGGIPLELVPPPVPGGHDTAVGTDSGGGTPRHASKALLRARNAERAKLLARLTGLEHKRVNAELNRLAGVRRIAEATVEDLQRRLAQADRWLADL